MFDLVWVPAGGPSAVEQVLADRLRTHASAAPSEVGTAAADEGLTAEGAGPERLLAEGATALSIAGFEQRRIDAALARRTTALAAFARWRPAAALDRQPGEVGAAAAETRAACPAVLSEVSEWAVDEVSIALSVSRFRATALLAEAVTLAEQLPATLAEVAGGRLGFDQARVLAELLGPVADPAVRAEVEQRLLGRAAGKTVAQLRAAARRQVLRADAAAAAERAVLAIRDRQVSVHPGDDGLATLCATLPAPLAVACRDALARYAAEVATPDDPRTKQQRMVDCLVDLVLRPGEHGLSAVQAQLTVVAPAATALGGDEPGEIGGQVVPAAAVRELLHALGLLPRPAADSGPPADADPQAGGPGTAEVAPPTEQIAAAAPVLGVAPAPAAGGPISASVGGSPALPDPWVDGADAARVALGRLLAVRDVGTTALVERPRLALVSELTGQLLALSCAAEARAAIRCGRPDCRKRPGACPHPEAATGLGPPPPTDGYVPSAALDRFVRARDRRCRFPGCRARPMIGDLDHTVPWPDGPTCCGNLASLCRHHHRLSHQAPGWRLEPTGDGGLRWVVPGGAAALTYPPGYGADDDLPPTAPPAAAPTGGGGRTAEDDPPPF